jgi:hypothetical protein
MRKILVAAVSGAAILYMIASPAGALSLDPNAVRPAVDAVSAIEKTACWRPGWHGWGWYHCWGHRYGYAWAQSWHWHRWHYWHHWHHW